MATRQREADEFYHRIAPVNLTADLRNIQRQAYAGMLWSKQYYHYIVEDWLKGRSQLYAAEKSSIWAQS